jgi:polysaccharide export outer membrane protein
MRGKSVRTSQSINAFLHRAAREVSVTWLKTNEAVCRIKILLMLCILTVTPQISAQGLSQARATGPLVSPPASILSNESGKEPLGSVLIGAGDLLRISILGATDSDQEVRVSADGNVGLNFIGLVHVAGLSIEQAEAAIAKKLSAGGFYTDPQVLVFQKEYATQGVSVLGEVLKPGVYPVLGSRRLFDVLSLAGGTTEKAGNLITITHRNTPDQPITIARSADPSTSVKENVEVFPGDTVVVSKAGIVYVVGSVHKAGGYIIENGRMTVLQAISMAEGVNPDSAPNKAMLIRNTPEGRQQIPLPLKKILAAKAPDVPVQAEDIIFIPNSAAKNAGMAGLDAALRAAIGIAIYRGAY